MLLILTHVVAGKPQSKTGPGTDDRRRMCTNAAHDAGTNRVDRSNKRRRTFFLYDDSS